MKIALGLIAVAVIVFVIPLALDHFIHVFIVGR